jgi:hypothetical protein
MKYRLSTLLFALTIVAVGLGWMCDRRRLLLENQRLNAECADLFRAQTEVIDITTDRWPIGTTGRPPDWILYDPADPEDRKNYREDRPPKIMAGKE